MTPGIRKTLAGLTIGKRGVPVVLYAGSVAAAGTNQATGAELIYTVNNVTGGNGTTTVRLPAASPGKLVWVYHATATVGLPVYPATGGTIDGGTANAAITIEGKTVAKFVGTSATNWCADYTANT